MKVLMIGPEYKDLGKVRNFSGVWSYYLAREFRAMGIAVEFSPAMHLAAMNDKAIITYHKMLPLDGIDHILALGTRYFSKLPPKCAMVLQQRCSGIVGQIYDRSLPNTEVINFCLRSDGADGDRNVHVGWAADAMIIQSAQPKGELRILIDHQNYGEEARKDLSKRILRMINEFIASKRWKAGYSSVRVRRIVDGGIEDAHAVAGRYERQSVGFETVAREYSQTHLFFVTHPESVGLSVLETALAGALPIVPAGFVPEDRLKTVRHVQWEKEMPWKRILGSIDISKSRTFAMKNDWRSVADKIVHRMEVGK